MKHNKIWILVFMTGILYISGCSYRKGDSYQYIEPGDTITFIVRKVGSGKKILSLVRKLTAVHTSREDEYKFIYLSDTLQIAGQKSVLLFNSEMPDFENDFLTKGYIGAFGTKEIVTYMVVTTEDFDQYFFPVNKRE